MGDSQSRYSIVERLTDKKLDIITAESELDANIKKKEQELAEAKQKLEDYKKDAESERAQHERELQRGIDRAQVYLENAKAQTAAKKDAYKEKLRAIEAALVRIEKVSESAGQQ